MDLEDGKSNLQLGHSQTAQDHQVSYKHLLEKRINDSYPKEEHKKNLWYLYFWKEKIYAFPFTEKKGKEKKNTLQTIVIHISLWPMNNNVNIATIFIS